MAIIPNITERYCENPPEPDPNGGDYTWDMSMNGTTPYQSYVEYSCGVARSLLSNTNTLLDIQTLICNWDKTWSPKQV